MYLNLPPLPFEERRVALSRGKEKIDFTVDALFIFRIDSLKQSEPSVSDKFQFS